MDSIIGIKNALDYIEEHITEKLDYAQIARQAALSNYHFQRVFGVLCGITLGEYIRNRRLALAGEALAARKGKVIDVALKYGYDSPDSFGKAFYKLHGITPSAAREPGAQLHAFPPLTIKISLEGGQIMKYRIEEKTQMLLTGYKRRFEGVPGERAEQEEKMFLQTKEKQKLLFELSGDSATQYTIIDRVGDTGYDFAIASLVDGGNDQFESFEIPARTYAVFETDRVEYPTELHLPLRKQIVSQWLPFSGYTLSEGPEINVIHWFMDGQARKQRYIEIWLPVVSK